MINWEFWVLSPKGLSDEKLLKSIQNGLESGDKILIYETEEDACKARDYLQDCEDDDVPRKVKINIGLVE